uniref:VHS domain-containing protein n=1 Tax=Amphilophus citrinellus TaxID=61819 RepID=A0A3Q0T6N3_AMPCI
MVHDRTVAGLHTLEAHLVQHGLCFPFLCRSFNFHFHSKSLFLSLIHFGDLIISDQATDPNNQEDRWDCIQGFYELINQETNGPQIAIRLLAHKIQSPEEKQALQALTVLEACMNNCGKRFHSEAAKFRFLNELIKVLTPKMQHAS